jgi:hypothetical protein
MILSIKRKLERIYIEYEILAVSCTRKLFLVSVGSLGCNIKPKIQYIEDGRKGS